MHEDPDEPVTLANLPNDADAAILVAHLETLGIKAMMSGAGGATGWPEAAMHTQVVVRRGDLAQAQAAARDIGQGE